MSYDVSYDFDSMGNVIAEDIEIQEEDYVDPSFDVEDSYDEDMRILGEFRGYENFLREKINKGEMIYESSIDFYSDYHKDAYGFRPDVSWLRVNGTINDYELNK